MQKHKPTLCLVAEGSAGHIRPALILGKNWKIKNPSGTIIFFGNRKKLDKKILSQYQNKLQSQNEFQVIELKLANVPGKKIWQYPLFLLQLTIAFCKSLYFLQKYKPSKITSTGGFLAIPICTAGTILKIPIELHELNVIPGKAIKALAFLASNIFITFKKSKSFFKGAQKDYSHKCILENYPLRFRQQDKLFRKTKLIDAINKLNSNNFLFTTTRKTMFILGGSQGSIFINNLIKRWLQKHKLHINNIQIIHQTGIQDQTDWHNFYYSLGIPALTFSYFQDIKNFYLLADFVICRGGAGTLFELEFFEKQSLIIPLKSKTTTHQIENSNEMVKQHPDLFALQDQEVISENFDIFEKQLNTFLFSKSTFI